MLQSAIYRNVFVSKIFFVVCLACYPSAGPTLESSSLTYKLQNKCHFPVTNGLVVNRFEYFIAVNTRMLPTTRRFKCNLL